MAVILRSDDIAPPDRVGLIRAAIRSGVLPVEIDWQQPAEELDLICKIAIAGQLNVSSARSATNRLRRTGRLAKVDHDPLVFVALQVNGTTRVEQNGHQAQLTRGDMVVYDSTKPYTVTNVDLTELHYFQVPRSEIALPDRVLNEILGVRIGTHNNSLAQVVAPYFASLGNSDVLDEPHAAALVAEPSVQLLRALIAHHVTDHERAKGPLDASLTLRIQQHIQSHLGERDLAAPTIAAAHNISVRHLYATMARVGIGIRETIQQQRLERCRNDLRDPRLAHLAVATVGSRWGFRRPFALRTSLPSRLRRHSQRVASSREGAARLNRSPRHPFEHVDAAVMPQVQRSYYAEEAVRSGRDPGRRCLSSAGCVVTVWTCHPA